MCGSGSHPGGGVMGAPGRNAAHVVLQDVKKRSRQKFLYTLLISLWLWLLAVNCNKTFSQYENFMVFSLNLCTAQYVFLAAVSFTW